MRWRRVANVGFPRDLARPARTAGDVAPKPKPASIAGAPEWHEAALSAAAGETARQVAGLAGVLCTSGGSASPVVAAQAATTSWLLRSSTTTGPVLTDALRSFVPRRAVRFHWHEVSANRLQMCQLLLAASHVRHVAAVATPLDPKRQERGRRLCLSAISWELDSRGVDRLQSETRRQRDANDRRFLLGEQRVDRLPAALQYEFGQPNQEALLWVLDAVAGAVAAAFGAGERRYLHALGDSVDVLQLPGPQP